MTIVTNFLMFLVTVFCFINLRKFDHSYSKDMGRFMLLVGVSSCFGSIAHGVHYQLGKLFFDVDFYIMNALSLISVFYCFRAPYVYYNLKNNKPSVNKTIPYFVMGWIICLLIYTLLQNNFVIIKIHAGLVLLYSFVTHILIYNKTKEKGSGLVIAGISISFFSIIVHSLKLSISEWFNYKDVAHMIIIASLLFIYMGAKENSKGLVSQVK